MPTYVYGCPQHKQVRIEIVHGMDDPCEFECPTCGEELVRIPQRFRWGFASGDILLDKLDQGYQNYKRKRANRHG